MHAVAFLQDLAVVMIVDGLVTVTCHDSVSLSCWAIQSAGALRQAQGRPHPPGRLRYTSGRWMVIKYSGFASGLNPNCA